MPAQARPAATVVVLQDGPDGPQILMLKRSTRAGFFPDAWVFPGGRVDPGDADVVSVGSVAGLDPDDTAFAVAAIRETFEEAGVWLGSGTPPEGLRDRLNEQSATLADAPELVADLDRLVLWSRWITPEAEPKRYDTRFFVALLAENAGADATHDQRETVESVWVTPADALARTEGAGFFLAPPTFRTLEELVEHKTGAAIMAAALERRIHPVMPRLDYEGEGIAIVLPGDASYPSDLPVDGPTRFEFRQGRWWSRG